MKQEDKELLLRDLCARLPYGIKIKTSYDKIDEPMELIFINNRNESFAIGGSFTLISGLDFDTYECNPYLFPLSSLTSSDAEAIEHIMGCDIPWNIQYGLLEWTVGGSVESETFDLRIEQIERLMEFLNSNHIDYRGLIEKGLAIDATNKNIY